MKARIRVLPDLLDCSRRTAAYTKAINRRAKSGTKVFTGSSFLHRVSQTGVNYDDFLRRELLKINTKEVEFTSLFLRNQI